VEDQVWFLGAMARDVSLPCYNLATANALDQILACWHRSKSDQPEG
jgi:hypothetical protein